MKAYKEIIEALAGVQTQADIDHICGMIDRAYHGGKISYKDNEQLYRLVQRMNDLIEGR